MLMKTKETNRKSTGRGLIRRTFAALYHTDTVNHCPACGHSHWIIGRAMAECAFCATALPLSASSLQPARPMFRCGHMHDQAA